MCDAPYIMNSRSNVLYTSRDLIEYSPDVCLRHSPTTMQQGPTEILSTRTRPILVPAAADTALANETNYYL